MPLPASVQKVPEKILEAYAYQNIANWMELRRFFVEHFVKESGFNESVLAAATTSETAQQLAEFTQMALKINGTERGNRVDYCAFGQEGAQYLNSINHPFPKPSLLSSAAPMITAVDVGHKIMSINTAVSIWENPGETELVLNASDLRRMAPELFRVHAKELKELLPGTSAPVIVNYVASILPLRPEAQTRLHKKLDTIFGTKTMLMDLSTTEIPTGTALS